MDMSNASTVFPEPENDACTKAEANEYDPKRTFRIIIYVFVIGFFCLFGFVGNAISITVLRKDRDKKNTTFWLLQALAVADTSYLFTSVFIYTLQTITDYTNWCPAMKTTFPYILPYVWPCASITQTITVWIILLITIHRYIAISRPLTARTMNPKYIKVAAVMIYIFAVLYNLSTFFERKVIVCENGQVLKKGTSLQENQTYFLIYHIIMHSLFKTVGPLLVLVVLTFGLVKELKKARIVQENLTHNGAYHNNITYMLVVVVIVFIVCELPDTLWRIIYSLQKYGNVKNISDDFIVYSNIVTHALLAFNSSVNFLIYGFTGTQFRNDLKKMFYCQKEQQTDLAYSSNLSLNEI